MWSEKLRLEWILIPICIVLYEIEHRPTDILVSVVSFWLPSYFEIYYILNFFHFISTLTIIEIYFNNYNQFFLIWLACEIIFISFLDIPTYIFLKLYSCQNELTYVQLVHIFNIHEVYLDNFEAFQFSKQKLFWIPERHWYDAVLRYLKYEQMTNGKKYVSVSLFHYNSSRNQR